MFGIFAGVALLLATVGLYAGRYVPLTFGTVSVVLIADATLGCAIPARRAMRVDPAIALRHE